MPTGEAYLTEAVAPWPCSTYLRIRVGDGEVCMPAERALPILSALNMLTAAAEAATTWESEPYPAQRPEVGA